MTKHSPSLGISCHRCHFGDLLRKLKGPAVPPVSQSSNVLFAKGAITSVHLSARGGLAGGPLYCPGRACATQKATDEAGVGGSLGTSPCSLGSKHKVVDSAP